MEKQRMSEPIFIPGTFENLGNQSNVSPQEQFFPAQDNEQKAA